MQVHHPNPEILPTDDSLQTAFLNMAHPFLESKFEHEKEKGILIGAKAARDFPELSPTEILEQYKNAHPRQT